jgi:hypothetical protein
LFSLTLYDLYDQAVSVELSIWGAEMAIALQ